MKKYKHLLDIVLLLGLSLLAALAISPDTLGMPSSLQMAILVSVLGLIATFLVVFWREQPVDEREIQNQAIASRTAYLIGSLSLIVALVVQSLRHDLDPAIPLTLLTMIATKIIVQRINDSR